MKWTILNKHNDMIVRDYLQKIHGFSRRLIKSVKFDGGDILVNGTGKTVRYALKTGDLLEIKFPPEMVAIHMQPERLDLSIIYEDDAIIVIDKPPQMAAIPSQNHPSGTLANRVLGYYEKNDIPFTVHIVTRLDRDTSGLVLIAKHRYSHSLLSALQISGGLKRKYKAVIEGQLSKKEGTIDAPIGRKADSIIERKVIDTGKQAITNYKVIDELKNYSLIEIELETGRTHQIRVHFSYIGHPLAGDDLYGGPTNIITRQALHCYEISFEHPLTKEHLLFMSELPDDMEQLVSGLH